LEVALAPPHAWAFAASILVFCACSAFEWLVVPMSLDVCLDKGSWCFTGARAQNPNYSGIALQATGSAPPARLALLLSGAAARAAVVCDRLQFFSALLALSPLPRTSSPRCVHSLSRLPLAPRTFPSPAIFYPLVLPLAKAAAGDRLCAGCPLPPVFAAAVAAVMGGAIFGPRTCS